MNDYLVFNEDESYQMNSNPRNPLGSFGKSSVSFSLSSLISILFSIGTAEISDVRHIRTKIDIRIRVFHSLKNADADVYQRF